MKKPNRYLLIVSLILGIYSCQKEELIIKESNSEEFSTPGLNSEPENMMELGDKIEDPYQLKNMKKAYKNLKGQSQFKSTDINIEATDLYVKFFPEDKKDIETLMNDTTLLLFDHPLNYEIKKRGYYYHDPEIPSDKPTIQYAVVPVGYQFPDVKYELIYKCFIPRPNGKTNQLKGTENADFLSLLEDEAYKITGNFDSEKENSEEKTLKGILPPWQNPEGYIRVWNTELNASWNLEGVRRVKVVTNRATKTGFDWTDDDGYYRIANASYRYHCNYSVRFENQTGFNIWGEFVYFTPVNYDIGSHSPFGYTKDIWQAYKAWKFAAVNNAVDNYYKYCDKYSITRPPSDLRVWVLHTNGGGSGSASMLRRTYGLFGFNNESMVAQFFEYTAELNLAMTVIANVTKVLQPDITISVNNNFNTSRMVSQLVFHECSHASHWAQAGNLYWVRYINYILNYGAYGNGTGINAGYCGVGEMWGNYAGAFFAMERYGLTPSWDGDWNWFVEGEDWYNPGFLKDVDAISDVTTGEIFGCLTNNTTTIDQLVSTLKSRTEFNYQVDNAYSNYNDWP